MTGQQLDSLVLRPNHALRSAIEQRFTQMKRDSLTRQEAENVKLMLVQKKEEEKRDAELTTKVSSLRETKENGSSETIEPIETKEEVKAEVEEATKEETKEETKKETKEETKEGQQEEESELETKIATPKRKQTKKLIGSPDSIIGIHTAVS